MWLAQSMKRQAPTADADQGVSTIVGDQMGVVTRGEVRQLPIYGPGGYVWLPESGALRRPQGHMEVHGEIGAPQIRRKGSVSGETEPLLFLIGAMI